MPKLVTKLWSHEDRQTITCVQPTKREIPIHLWTFLQREVDTSFCSWLYNIVQINCFHSTLIFYDGTEVAHTKLKL